MKEVLEGRLTAEAVQQYIDPCLGCLACEPACPSGVSYRNLISPFKALTKSKQKRTWGEKFSRAIAERSLPYPRRFRIATRLGRLAKPFAKLLPKPLRVMLDLLPDQLPPRQDFPETIKPSGKLRGRVALLAGCAQQVLDPDINAATIEVLTRNGVEVIIPPKQGCCGALSWHIGNLAQAQKFARQNLEAFPNDVDAIITNAAGCGSGLHEYDLILKGTAFEKQAEAFASKVCDISVFLHRLGDLEPIPDDGSKRRIAYHDACHLANAQGVRSEPRSLLLMIPGTEVVDVPEANNCCGSAGTYNIDQPDIAATLGRKKAEKVKSMQPDIVVSGNIGCITQLNNYLPADGKLRVRHTMQVVRDAYASRLKNG